MTQWLEALARFEWEPQKYPTPEPRVGDFYYMAEADRDGFLRDLAALAVPVGGWVVLGAKYLVMDILPVETDTPDFNAIVFAAFTFLRSNGVPPIRLSPNDRELWKRVRRGDEPWAVGLPAPVDTLRPLQPGEVRKVAGIKRADGHWNEILVHEEEPGKFVALVRGTVSDEDPRIVENKWYTVDSLHGLYLRIGESCQVPPAWSAPELEPYFPLRLPTI